MTWIKLCGLRTRQDVQVALDLHVDAIGFVTAARSPRRISPRAVAEIGGGTAVETYLVTLDLPPEALLRDAAASGVSGVQPHGRHARAAARAALGEGYRVLLPIDVAVGVDIDDVPPDMVPIFDAARPGSGVVFDWTAVAGVERPFVLAGGLSSDNVADALAAVAPYGVDVSSGIESTRGVKDHELMRRFVEAVR